MPTFQKRHPAVPWIVFQPVPGGVTLRCEVCNATATLTPQQADAFARQHAAHRSASPTHMGLGDVVAKVAQPVARALGRTETCLPCERKKHALNSLVPRAWRR